MSKNTVLRGFQNSGHRDNQIQQDITAIQQIKQSFKGI